MKDPIRIEGLTVRYGRATACADVSLVVPAGAVYALLGRNGAGKSSLVRCLLGQQKPSAGQALLFGEDSWTTRRAAMARIGVVPEEPDAPPALSARHALGFLPPDLSPLGFRRRVASVSAVSRSRPRLRSESSRRARRVRCCWRSRSVTPRSSSFWTIRLSASMPWRAARSSRRSSASSPTAGRRLSHDARPCRLRRHRHPCRHPQGREARSRRGRRGSQVPLPPDPLRRTGSPRPAPRSAPSSTSSTPSA